MTRLTIAIDGPAGAGKSTVAKAVAAALGYTYIDTGAMYRAVALRAMQLGVDTEDPDRLGLLAEDLRIEFIPSEGGVQRVLANGHDVTTEIRSPEATRLSSPVSAVPAVRRALVMLQRQMGLAGGVVMEGRDIGTVVFPNAEVKVFLTASDRERANRRWCELRERGLDVSLEDVLAQQKERDKRDTSREDSPLKPAHDAVIVNTDNMTIEQVTGRILDIAKERGA